MPDFFESPWQNMLQEASDKFEHGQRFRFPCFSLCVFIGKCHLAILKFQYPFVGDRHTKHVWRETQYRLLNKLNKETGRCISEPRCHCQHACSALPTFSARRSAEFTGIAQYPVVSTHRAASPEIVWTGL